MPAFTTTTKLTHRFPLPPSATLSAATTILHDHDWFIRLNPEMVSYSQVPTPSKDAAAKNASEKTEADKVKTYKVMNNVNGIPKAIYDAKVDLEVQITDVDDGADFLVHAPMGSVQRAKWRIVGEQGAWQLVIDTEITCSRLVMGIMKGKGETDTPSMGKAFIQRLEK